MPAVVGDEDKSWGVGLRRRHMTAEEVLLVYQHEGCHWTVSEGQKLEERGCQGPGACS